ncbi:Pre-mRNA-splicing factor sap61 [Coemansia sp. RSA 552]|nr:Pre-mRNA-splicing factor sap61 [Coemansia sp. RSA 552]
MDSIVEQQRQAYEDIERLEQAAVDLMLQDLSKHRHRLVREQKINGLLEQIQDRSQLLERLDQDESGLRTREMDLMARGQFDEFYARLGDIHNYHARNPGMVVHPPELDYVKYTHNPEDEAAKRSGENEEVAEVETFIADGDMQRLETMFSGEERLGRYVDLNAQHAQYLALKGAQRLSYLEYLAGVSRVSEQIPSGSKDAQYAEYLDSVCTYFEGFFARAMPLFDVGQVKREAQEAFEAAWAKRQTAEGTEGASEDSTKALFCAVCQRQFEKETTLAAHLKSRKHKNAVGRQQRDPEQAQANAAQRVEREKQTAWRETLVDAYVRALSGRIADTRANVQRRQALTEVERRQEGEESGDEAAAGAESDTDEADHIYNPLNLPMGWDGKPIPFWLYKLHGLGVSFTCEICGNTTYRGRKAYERHFQEQRHAANLRRLGIPSSRQFHGIAGIGEARALWDRVQSERKRDVANVDTFEEYEDSEGNVFNRKTYLDLKRQGLI